MIVFPTEQPVLENLNSYYLDLQKLLEHHQGQLASGVIHFASASAEGAIFFEEGGLLEGVYENGEEKLLGEDAIERLMQAAKSNNFIISVFRIGADEVYFWASLLRATRVYEGLSAEFTDLEGLIRKMASERLSGYIEISLNRSLEEGRILFRNGQILGQAHSREKRGLDRSGDHREEIIQAAKERGGVFHVSKISPPKAEAAKEELKAPSQEILGTMGELLAVLEKQLHDRKSSKSDFGILLKKQCVNLAETYPFLDPFAGEFAYSDREIRFKGHEREERVAEGLLVAVKKLAEENGLQSEFRAALMEWLKKHDIKPSALGIKA